MINFFKRFILFNLLLFIILFIDKIIDNLHEKATGKLYKEYSERLSISKNDSFLIQSLSDVDLEKVEGLARDIESLDALFFLSKLITFFVLVVAVSLLTGKFGRK